MMYAGMAVAILPCMFSLLRFTTIALSVLVFAVVLTVCGEAVACGGCVHACCVRTDRPERRREDTVAQIANAGDRLVEAIRPASVILAIPLTEGSSGPSSPPLLAAKVAQLRI